MASLLEPDERIASLLEPDEKIVQQVRGLALSLPLFIIFIPPMFWVLFWLRGREYVLTDRNVYVVDRVRRLVVDKQPIGAASVTFDRRRLWLNGGSPMRPLDGREEVKRFVEVAQASRSR